MKTPRDWIAEEYRMNLRSAIRYLKTLNIYTIKNNAYPFLKGKPNNTVGHLAKATGYTKYVNGKSIYFHLEDSLGLGLDEIMYLNIQRDPKKIIEYLEKVYKEIKDSETVL